MKRKYLIAAAALIAVASTSVIATAHSREDGPGRHEGRGGSAMMFERFDTNGDGTITKAEVEGAAAAHFAEADTNGDGLLSADEMTAAAEAHRAERRADRMAERTEEMLERHDTNGDGMLSLEEMTAQRDGRGMERMFERFDTDGDGSITQAEMQDAGGKMGHGRRGHGKGYGHN